MDGSKAPLIILIMSGLHAGGRDSGRTRVGGTMLRSEEYEVSWIEPCLVEDREMRRGRGSGTSLTGWVP